MNSTTHPVCGVCWMGSEARSRIPLASIMVSLLVAERTSLVAVCNRADEVRPSSFIIVPLLLLLLLLLLMGVRVRGVGCLRDRGDFKMNIDERESTQKKRDEY